MSLMDKTEHTHPKNGFSPGLKIAKNAIKKRSIAVQKRIKWPKTAKKRSIATHFKFVTIWT